jgi:negative regulator of genetic competence, sporulation and motility
MKNPPSKPSQLITKEFARQLNVNYNNKKASLTSKKAQKEDANAIWYSLEELENYIHYIKTNGAKEGYNVDGIRFYFGVYPDDEKHGEKAGLTTLFLVPTGKQLETSTAKIQSFTLAQEASPDIQSLEPMNYGNIGRPPSLLY